MLASQLEKLVFAGSFLVVLFVLGTYTSDGGGTRPSAVLFPVGSTSCCHNAATTTAAATARTTGTPGTTTATTAATATTTGTVDHTGSTTASHRHHPAAGNHQ